MRVHAKFRKDDAVSDFYFIEPSEVLTEDTHTFEAALEAADRHAQNGQYVIPAITYEAGSKRPQDDYPSFIIGVFEAPVSGREFYKHDSSGIYRMGALEFLEPESVFKENIGKIKDYIRGGHTYQVNYTTRLEGDFDGDAHALFLQLTADNNGDYAMFIEWEGCSILSCSPELFFEVDRDRCIRTRPMKGTARRFNDPAEDEESYNFLRHSKKDRAENVMIVDLLRNDLSKVARKGTVGVPGLFTVEKYDTVYQMTSTIEAELRDGAGLPEIMEALFPCGSITGAPKESTMKIIEELEYTPRGFYCGTLGMMFPDGTQVFNVPIRTLYIKDNRYIYGAGGGITYDSDPDSEYDEMVAKTAFLEGGRYRLIESMRLESGEVKRFGLHHRRILKSARALAFKPPAFKKAVSSHINGNNDLKTGLYKLRAAADPEGNVSVSHGAVTDMDTAGAKLAGYAIQAPPMFLSNKTTVRHQYHSADDEFGIVLYYNEYHQVTEFNIGNIVVEENGEFFTPPLTAGLLNGVMRKSLIKSGMLQTRNYTKDELIEKYQQDKIKIHMINSVREWVEISLNIPG